MAKNLLDSEMLARIVDGSSIPSFVVDKQHRVTYWNRAIEALTAIKREDIVGTNEQWRAFYAKKRPSMADLIVDGASTDEIAVHYRGKFKRSSLIDGAYTAESFFPDLGKRGKWLHFTAAPIKDNNNETVAAIETLQDITQRKKAEEALNESEKRLRALFKGAHDAIWVHDLDGNIQTANRASAKLSGYTLKELIGMNVKSFLSDESLKLSREIDNKLVQRRSVLKPHELRIIRKDGSEVICMVTTNLVASNGKPQGFQNIARDVTQEKRMEENLHYYLRQITRAQERERRRIARELHDDTVQLMGSLSRQLDNFIRKKPGFTPDDVSFLKCMQAQLNRGVQSVHRFAQNLRPSILDDLGLVPALRSLVKDLQEYSGIEASLQVIGKERRLSSEVESILFRIVQEALSNISRHSKASNAQMMIEFADNRIEVIISDNGVGFELSGGVDDLPCNSGKLGLAGMQERALLLGGTIDIRSSPGKGTTLILKVPV